MCPNNIQSEKRHLELTGEKVIVALDSLSLDNALALAEKLKGRVWGFKVNDLLLSEGVSIISQLKNYGRVFADPKLYDIPNTVKNSVAALSKAGASLITVHASGGRKMMEAAVSAAQDYPTQILAVTVLTSFDEEDTREIYLRGARDLVKLLAEKAKQAGCRGVVCSPKEAEMFSASSDLHGLLKVTPGIRLSPSSDDDQKRTSSARSALAAGSDLLVIGRPITESDCPVSALAKVMA